MPKALQILFFILLIALARWAPWPGGLSPVLAMILYVGAVLRPRALAVIVAASAILFSDVALGFYQGMVGVYLAFASVGIIGWTLERPTHNRLINKSLLITSVLGAVSFFIISNFSVWLTGLLYPKTISGLWTCFVAALPFFEKTLLATILFTPLVFRAAELVDPTPQTKWGRI